MKRWVKQRAGVRTLRPAEATAMARHRQERFIADTLALAEASGLLTVLDSTKHGQVYHVVSRDGRRAVLPVLRMAYACASMRTALSELEHQR